MNELAVHQNGDLPTKPSDLAKFMIVAQEKVKAVKAEIRAIQKLNLAKEVYAQKMEEQRRLQEVILLAYQRMGEITREMPKAAGKRTDQGPLPANGQRLEGTKAQAIKGLGFSTSQVNRMEQMAAHPDIVEEVIAESQAGQTEATQTEVLRRIKEQGNVIDLTQKRKERFNQDIAQIDEDYEVIKEFHRAIHSPLKLPVSNSEVVATLVRATHSLSDLFTHDLDMLEEAIQKLRGIQILLRKEAHQRGKNSNHQPGGAGSNQAATSQSGRVDQIGAD